MDAILTWKTSKKLKQTQLAAWLGKSQPAVSNILTGKTELSIADAKILIKKSNGYLTLEKIFGGDHA